ncbi:MAG: sugar-binding protein [Verrucomicrobiia bacterium]
MHRIHILPLVLLLATGSALAKQETSVPGQQWIVAHRTQKPVVIDGILGAAEWAAAIPIHVDAVKPTTAPGVIPSYLSPPDNQDDLSFAVRAMYDDDNLYVAVRVADDILLAPFADPTLLWMNDDVEILIDGDRQPWDLVFEELFGYPCGDPYVNQEGYQLITPASLDGARQTVPACNNVIAGAWTSAFHLAPRGYVVEVKIPLDIINTHNNLFWDDNLIPIEPSLIVYRPPQPGDVIGFNVFVGDNDSGRSYADPTGVGDSFLAWDGNGGVDESGNSLWGGPFVEPDWGNLYFAP